MKLRFIAALLLALCSCGGNTPAGPGLNKVPEDAQPTPKERALSEGPSLAARTHGVPHSNNIDMVVLASDGTMAMSRDAMGGVRFWPGLDGKAEPALVPVRGARSFSLRSSGEESTLAVIDGIGALHILSARADGSINELYMSSPHQPLQQAEVLKGGQRILTLAQDHTLSLLDLSGKSLASLQERRFRPNSLRLVQGDSRALMLSTDPATIGVTVTLRAVAIDLAKDSLVLDGKETEVEGVLNLEDKRFSINESGTKVAFLGIPKPPEPELSATPEARRKLAPQSGPVASRPAPMPIAPPTNTATTVIIWDLASGAQESVNLGFPAHELMQVGLGFVANDTLVVTSRPSGGSWRIKLGKETTSYGLTSAVAQDTQRSAHDFANGIHLAADGTWLFVQDTNSETNHYLGYSLFDPQHASLAPGSNRVAWTTSQMIFIESLSDESESLRITAPPTEAYFRAAFIDEDHLVAIDYSGGLHLIDWRKGEQLGTIDTGGAVREFEVDQARKLVRGIRQNGGAWVCELVGDGLKGPYLIQDQGYRSGFLRDDQALWTIDAQQRYHSYSLADLRAGLSAKQLQSESPTLSAGSILAIDSSGHRYVLNAQKNPPTLNVNDAMDKELHSLEIPWTPLQTHASPDGSKLALVSSDGAIVDVYDQKTGMSLWSMSIVQGIRHVSWSMDSQTLAVASQVGAVVFKADSGEQVRLGCGPWFERRTTAPPSTVTFMQVQNLCER